MGDTEEFHTKTITKTKTKNENEKTPLHSFPLRERLEPRDLSKRLTEQYGAGWSIYKLQHCVRAAYTFTEDEIVYATRTQLSWTHLRSLMGVKDALERQFYAQICTIEHWDTRTLDEKIDQQLYQRTAISRKPEDVIKKELQEAKNNNRWMRIAQ